MNLKEKFNPEQKTYFKAFDYDKTTHFISCRQEVFSKTDWNILRKSDGTINTDPLRNCHNGYHFCHDLFDINGYYDVWTYAVENVNGNYKNTAGPFAIAEIEVKDAVFVENDNKHVCREFKIVKLYSDAEEIYKLFKREYLNRAFKIIDPILDKMPDLIITGGFSHIFTGLKTVFPLQELHDIDFSIPNYISKQELTRKIYGDKYSNSNSDNITPYKTINLEVEEDIILGKPTNANMSANWVGNFDDDSEVADSREYLNLESEGKQITISNGEHHLDFFVNQNQAYEVYEYNGRKYNVATPWIALEYKLDFIKKGKNEAIKHKHLNDLINIFINMKKGCN